MNKCFKQSVLRIAVATGHQYQNQYKELSHLSKKLIAAIVCVSAVAGIGGINNGAKRNVKADLRACPKHSAKEGCDVSHVINLK